MSKSLYILVLLLLSFGYFNNIYTNAILTRDVNFILVVLWGLIGWFFYEDKQYSCVNNSLNMAVPITIMAVLVISPLLPMVQYDQSYLAGAIAQRFNYVILLLLVFLRMRPSEKEIMKSMQICSYITVIYYLITIFKPEFFLEPDVLEAKIESRISRESTDIGFTVPGFDVAVFYLFFKLSCIFKKYTKKDIFDCFLILSLVFMMQNRSTLLGTAPILMFLGYKLVVGRNWKIISLAFFILLAASPFLFVIIQELVEETELQMEDDSYTRWIGIEYFTVEKKDNMFNILLGNGVCGRTGRYAEEMLGRTDIFISDIGWLGTYYYYGIIPLLVLLGFSLYNILERRIPHYLRFYSIWVLMVPTIHCFLILDMGKNILYSLFFYLIMYQRTYKFNIKSRLYGFICNYCKLQYMLRHM